MAYVLHIHIHISSAQAHPRHTPPSQGHTWGCSAGHQLSLCIAGHLAYVRSVISIKHACEVSDLHLHVCEVSDLHLHVCEVSVCIGELLTFWL